MNPELTERLADWTVEPAGIDETAEIGGSPDRAAERTVILDRSGSRWILEKIEPHNLSRKQEVAGHLEKLSALKQIHPYCRTAGGSFFSGDRMLRPYIDGIPLERPGYLNDSWRIDELAVFLIRLREQTLGWNGPRFSIASYAASRMKSWRVQYPERAKKLEHSFTELNRRFFPFHDRLPVAFCHGDYHPLNAVWGDSSIRSVIDWEFCGIKPELYDVALLTGCIGFEDPDNLIREPVIRLIKNLRAAGFGSAESWEHFLELTVAIRFGWMSEWFRRRDREAAGMESAYMDILIDQRNYILDRWQASRPEFLQ